MLVTGNDNRHLAIAHGFDAGIGFGIFGNVDDGIGQALAVERAGGGGALDAGGLGIDGDGHRMGFLADIVLGAGTDRETAHGRCHSDTARLTGHPAGGRYYARGRSPDWRVTALIRPSRSLLGPVASREQELAAYSCGGSFGLAPNSHLSRHGLRAAEPRTLHMVYDHSITSMSACHDRRGF